MRQGVKKENGRDEIPRCVVEVKQRKKKQKKVSSQLLKWLAKLYAKSAI